MLQKVKINQKARERASHKQRKSKATANPKKAKAKYTLQRSSHNGVTTMTMIRMMMATGIRSNVIDNFLHIYSGKASNSGIAIKIQVTPGLGGRIAIQVINNNNHNINLFFNQ